MKPLIISVFIGITISLVLFGLTHSQASPLPQQSFTPPTTVKLSMYVLNPADDSLFRDKSKNLVSCTVGSTQYGCTWYDGRPQVGLRTEPYPFSSSDIEIGYEDETRQLALKNDTTANIQLGYLHNVVTREIQEGTTLSAYAAQAIAARTYAYHQTNGDTRINNSANRQVYIPFRFEAIGGVTPALRKQKVHNAIALPRRLYMTLPASTEPIVAFFGKDNGVNTTNNPNHNYLNSVYDPISTVQGQPIGTTYGGMGSSGASRWGFGNVDVANNGDKWPVQWGEEPGTIDGDSWRNGFQILTHYYSGIHIRNQAGSLQTPDLRWNALDIRWNGSITPPKFVPGLPQSSEATITVQNTGTGDWAATGNRRYYLAYRWMTDNQTGDKKNPVQVVTNETVSPGEHLPPVRLTVASPEVTTSQNYTLSIDMYYQDNDGPLVGFSRATSLPWFTHDIRFKADDLVICPQQVGGCGGSVERYSYLPIIMKPGDLPPRPSPTPTQPTSTHACQAGRLLFTDSFEEGNPFKSPGDDDDDDDFGFDPRLQGDLIPLGQVRTGKKSDIDNPDSMVASGRWTIQGYNSYTVPAKVNLEDKNNTNEEGDNEDGVRLGGENDEDNPGRGDVDQLMTIAVPMYAGTKKLRLTFDTLLETKEPRESWYTPPAYDHFYASLKSSENESGDNLAPPYECNEDVATDPKHPYCWNETWVRTKYDIELSERWETTTDDQVYLHFWTDVDNSHQSTFYLDNLELEIVACQ